MEKVAGEAGFEEGVCEGKVMGDIGVVEVERAV